MKHIEWHKQYSPIGRGEIEKVEEALGIRFPDDYVNCAMINHGGTPRPKVFTVGTNGEVFNYLFGYDPNELDYILECYHDLKDRLEVGIVPFADDPGGNMICFDYREGDSPTIVFWDHEVAFTDPGRAITPICNTFTELLEMLRPFEDEE